ncbi:MAG: ubiquitin-like small modifier protein 1, partial [Candidatus Sifarchaeia archaeon]
REFVGQKSIVELDLKEDANITELLNELLQDLQIKEALLDENEALRPDVTILKNGREIRFLDGLATRLDPGDEISVFPIVAGG